MSPLPAKRVLIFSTAYLPLVGGAEFAVKEITDRLGGEFEFVMLTARLDAKLPEIERIGNIEVHRIGEDNHWDKYRLVKVGWQEARKLGRFDLVWAIMASYGGFAALRYKKRNPAVPFLLTLQEGDSRWQIYKHVWWCWPYFKQIFQRADRIQAISNYLAAWARQLGAKCPVEVVPNGVDIERFNCHSDRPRLSRGSGGILLAKLRDSSTTVASAPFARNDVSLVITASRLVKKNGVADLIKAMQFLPPSVHLLIAGSGPLEGKLKSLAKQLHLAERVHFLGSLSHDELPKYLWDSDVFCRPSRSEGLGSAFLEAMAAGLPVVATPVGGIPDFLQDGETGLFCQVGDPKDIAEKIKKIFDDKLLAERLRENSRKLIAEKYIWQGIARDMQVIFSQL